MVNLFNVSETGCAIFIDDASLDLGRIYSLRTEGIELLLAEVVWIKDRYAGLVFAEPLYPAVAENLARMFPVVTKSPSFENADLRVEMARQAVRENTRHFDLPLRSIW